MERNKTGKQASQAGGIAVLEQPQAAKQDMTGKIREAAYLFYEKSGHAHGNDLQDWFEAEKMIKREYK